MNEQPSLVKRAADAANLALNDVFAALFSNPFTTIFIFTTLFVLYVPVAMLLDASMYSNVPHASMAVKSSPFFNNILLAIHIGAALPAILIGPWMFHTPTRNRHLALHRTLGKIYVLGCMISAISVVPLALANAGGRIAHIGFGTMSVVWFFTTYFSYMAIRNRDYAAHRRWMMRSYALTFAFVHVNFTYRLFFPYDAFTVQGIKAFQSCVSWQANLLAVEIYLALSNAAGNFVGWKKFLHNLSHYNPADRFYFRIANKQKPPAAS